MSASRTSDFFGMADESSRLLARQAETRGLVGSGNPKLTRTGPLDELPRKPLAPLGTRAGEAVRSTITRAGIAALNTAVAGGTAAANIVTAPVRAAGGVVRDFTRAATGQQPSADAGQPLAGVGASRLIRTGPAAGVPVNPSGPQNGRPGPRNPTATAPAAPAAAAPAQGTLNTFTGSDGRTVSIDAAPAGVPSAAAAAPAATPRLTRAANAQNFDPQAQVRSSVDDLRDVARTVRNDAAAGLNPMSADAEILRRLENSQGSYFNKGRPGARAAQAQAYLGQLAARQGASADFQQGATSAIKAGAEGIVQEGLNAQDNRARSRLQRAGIRGQLELQREAVSQPELLGGADDGVLRLRRGGSATAVMDENGRPIREARSTVGALTPQDLLKAYTAEREAIQGSLGSAQDKAAAMAALESDPLYRPILGPREAPAVPPLEEFLERARSANSGVSDEELTDFYRTEYGSADGLE